MRTNRKYIKLKRQAEGKTLGKIILRMCIIEIYDPDPHSVGRSYFSFLILEIHLMPQSYYET